MAKRASWRIPININLKLHCCDKGCLGYVTNLSENGMSIITNEMCFPKKSEFEIIIPLKEETLHSSVKLARSIKTDFDDHYIGVELLNPPKKYLNFVNNLLLVL
jgi:hypothetical protein